MNVLLRASDPDYWFSRDTFPLTITSRNSQRTATRHCDRSKYSASAAETVLLIVYLSTAHAERSVPSEINSAVSVALERYIETSR